MRLVVESEMARRYCEIPEDVLGDAPGYSRSRTRSVPLIPDKSFVTSWYQEHKGLLSVLAFQVSVLNSYATARRPHREALCMRAT